MRYDFNNIKKISNKEHQIIQLLLLQHNKGNFIGHRLPDIDELFTKILNTIEINIIPAKVLKKYGYIQYALNGYYSMFDSGCINELQFVELLYNNNYTIQEKYIYIKYLSKLQEYMEKRLPKSLLDKNDVELLLNKELILLDGNFVYFYKEYEAFLNKLNKDINKSKSKISLNIIDYAKKW